MTNGEVATLLPCLECLHWRAPHVRAMIGRVFLAVERGEHPVLPFASGVPLHGCRSDEFDTGR